jgi:solute carrier family 25 phosphate transporter 3
MVSDTKFSADSTISAITRIVKNDGVASLFSSFWAMSVKQVPYTAVKQVCFDLITAVLYGFGEATLNKKLIDTQWAWVISITAAFFTSVLSCLASQPGDMIMTAMCKGHDCKIGHPRIGTFGAINTIYSEHGLGGFFIGTRTRLLHVVSIVTTQLVIYDTMKRALGLAATGSH